MGGGGSSSGDYAQQQAALEAKKAASRNALNALFGVSPSAPDPANYTKADSGGGFFDSWLNPIKSSHIDPILHSVADKGGTDYVPDGSAYGQAYKDYQTQLADAAKNKTARDALYQTVRDNAFGAGKTSLDDRRTTAQRQNKFALFAQGLNGGSEDIDQNALLQRTYNQGLLDLGAKADAAEADLKGSDEQTRLGLLQSIDAGMDQSSALSSALGQLQVNSDKASAAAQGTTIGDLFGDAGLLYTQSQAAKGRNAASYAYQNLFSPAARPAGSSSGSGGIITKT